MMERQNPRRINPPEQLAHYQETRAEDDDELTDAEIIDMYRHPEVYGWGCEIEGGWTHPDGQHDDPNKYTDEELLAMNEAANEAGTSLCLMHLDVRYPKVPDGWWGMHVGEAIAALDEATRRHTGRDAFDLAGGEGWQYHATAAELRQVWDDWPDARWFFEEEPAYDVRVVES